MPTARPHGSLLAADVGELVGVSGTTIGQWARRGYIRSSQREEEPRLYSVEDVAEATMVRQLLSLGVRRREVLGAVRRLRGPQRPWPLSGARLAVARGRLLLHDPDDGWLELGARGWQATAEPGALEEVSVRLATTA